MIYAGIDIAKLNHFASVVSSDGEVLVEPFKFSNDSEGFRCLSSKLDQFDNQRPTTAITLLSSFSQKVTGSVSLTRSRLLLCGKTMSAKQRRIGWTPL